MYNFSLKHTSLPSHVAASISVSHFHLTRAASDISPRRDEMSDERSHNCVPLSPPHLLQCEDLCLNDSHGRRLLWPARNACSGDNLWIEDTEGPKAKKKKRTEKKNIYRHKWFIKDSGLLSYRIFFLYHACLPNPGSISNPLGDSDSVLMGTQISILNNTQCNQCSDILGDKAGKRKRVCQGCCSCHTAPLQTGWQSTGPQ